MAMLKKSGYYRTNAIGNQGSVECCWSTNGFSFGNVVAYAQENAVHGLHCLAQIGSIWGFCRACLSQKMESMSLKNENPVSASPVKPLDICCEHPWPSVQLHHPSQLLQVFFSSASHLLRQSMFAQEAGNKKKTNSATHTDTGTEKGTSGWGQHDWISNSQSTRAQIQHLQLKTASNTWKPAENCYSAPVSQMFICMCPATAIEKERERFQISINIRVHLTSPKSIIARAPQALGHHSSPTGFRSLKWTPVAGGLTERHPGGPVPSLVLPALVPGGDHGSRLRHVLQLAHRLRSRVGWEQQLRWTRSRWGSIGAHGVARLPVRSPGRQLLSIIIAATVAPWAACGGRRQCHPPASHGAVRYIIFRVHLFALWFAPLETEWEKTFALPRGWGFWLRKALHRWRRWDHSNWRLRERSGLAIVELGYPFPATQKKIAQQSGRSVNIMKHKVSRLRYYLISAYRQERSPGCSRVTKRQN